MVFQVSSRELNWPGITMMIIALIFLTTAGIWRMRKVRIHRTQNSLKAEEDSSLVAFLAGARFLTFSNNSFFAFG
jgi:hypothetical protein